MKKLILPFIISAFVLSLSAFALSPLVFNFTDSDTFDGWYIEAVNKMAAMGVVQGYPDGSFGPTNNVNRAELVVMLNNLVNITDRAGVEQLEDQIFVMGMMDDLDVPSDVRSALTLANLGVKAYDGVPSLDDLLMQKVENANIPQGYEVYSGSFGFYYVHFTYSGGVPESGEVVDIDQWYGPYSIPLFMPLGFSEGAVVF